MVDLLMVLAIYIGIAWSIYMSLLFRREYRKMKEEAVRKVDEVVEKVQDASGKLGLSIISLAAISTVTVFVAYILLKKENYSGV